MQAQLRLFSHHVYNIRRQFQELRHLKEQLRQDEIIIHEDFSENFQLKHQREIMESHWSNESVTVFTAVVYYKDDNKDLQHLSYALISDELSHDKRSVYVFNKALLDAVSREMSFKQMHYWSDGAGSPFKNRFNLACVLYHPLDYETQATWSFFETAHGKGAVDGVGGAVKRAVWRAILQDRAVVNSAEEFARVAENECLKVKVLYIPKEDITQVEEQRHQRWNVCIPIPETYSIHFVSKISDTTVSVAKNSQFLKQDTCREHVLLFSLGPRVGESATIDNANQKTAHEVNQKPQSGRCNKPAGEKGYKPGSQKSQKGDSEKSPTSDSKTSQNPDNKKSQNPGSEMSQKPEIEKSQKPDSEMSQNPGSETSEKPDSEKSRNPDIEKSQNPDNEKSQEPRCEKSQKPNIEMSRKPDSEKSQNTDSEKVQGPRSEKSQKPTSEKSPNSEKTQTPDSDKSRKTSSWRSQEPSSQKSKKSNSQKNQKPRSRKRQKTESDKGQQSESDDEVEILAHKGSSPLHTVTSTCSFKPPVNIKFGLPHNSSKAVICNVIQPSCLRSRLSKNHPLNFA